MPRGRRPRSPRRGRRSRRCAGGSAAGGPRGGAPHPAPVQATPPPGRWAGGSAAGERRAIAPYAAAMQLTAAEGRVLGCLVEKHLTTPQLYPLTDNALIAACNQTTNRDPVVDYDVATVRMAVRELRQRGLLRTVHRTGERSDKHQHLLDAALGLSEAEIALVAVLLLRGPQTVGELRARTDRMHPFGSGDEVEQVLGGLAGRDEPLVTRLERQ